MNSIYVNIAYLVASSFFVFGLKDLAHPRTATRGNRLGALGMLIAVLITLFDRRIVSYEIIFAGMLAGSAAGIILAQKAKMTAVPQIVAVLNGLGGGASVLVAAAAFAEIILLTQNPSIQFTLSTAAAGFIGAVTFCGSLLAFGKLQGITTEKALRFQGQDGLNVVLMIIIAAFGGILVIDPSAYWAYWALVAVSSILGVLLIIPVGGADMPVIIALLNSYSGLAAAATGFVLSNNLLIISGALVGASGVILTKIMCKAMNRSFGNCVFGRTGSSTQTGRAADIYEGRVKSVSPDDAAMLLDTAQRVVITPGYGLAVSQAQHAVSALVTLLESRGIDVEFGIHPVAGRMPGHMNVLLAEANIPYDKLKTMDEINPTFDRTDVVLVIGANDVVNPLARTDPKSPIAGMPILNVDHARTVIVIKRSLSPGFAGIPNPLFAADNTMMLFGDGKKIVQELITAIEAL
ncbi:MAG: NAD synthetase [Deltaproteobacteria bacterium HGW-Deltaproteobacteria-6]|nr:MAG: NAD synthetase [Deltaproteobacteria bacterium HGW-Deltaproteobacteria-6]